MIPCINSNFILDTSDHVHINSNISRSREKSSTNEDVADGTACHPGITATKMNENTSTHIIEGDKEVNKDNSDRNEFVRVSEDVSELVQHLNSIQTDMSELAGRPFSIVGAEKDGIQDS